MTLKQKLDFLQRLRNYQRIPGGTATNSLDGPLYVVLSFQIVDGKAAGWRVNNRTLFTTNFSEAAIKHGCVFILVPGAGYTLIEDDQPAPAQHATMGDDPSLFQLKANHATNIKTWSIIAYPVDKGRCEEHWQTYYPEGYPCLQ